MNIAVFGDVHGRVLLAFLLCARWERETGERIDLVLQVGDLGAFPIVERLDKATLRYADRDETELGFLRDFVVYDDVVAEVLGRTRCDLVFVRGNHEDHRWLDICEREEVGPVFVVDVYQRVLCLKTGVPYTFGSSGEQVTMLGIGRTGRGGGALKDIHIQPYERRRLEGVGDVEVDILLTHDMASGRSRRSMGMEEISVALQRYRPRYHFYGHIGGECLMGVAENGVTQYCKLADLEWYGASRIVRPGSMAILRWEGREKHELRVVEEDWYKEYSAATWRYL